MSRLLNVLIIVAILCSTLVASRPLSEVDDALLPIIADVLIDMERRIEVPEELAEIVDKARRKLKRESRNRWERLGPAWG